MSRGWALAAAGLPTLALGSGGLKGLAGSAALPIGTLTTGTPTGVNTARGAGGRLGTVTGALGRALALGSGSFFGSTAAAETKFAADVPPSGPVGS